MTRAEIIITNIDNSVISLVKIENGFSMNIEGKGMVRSKRKMKQSVYQKVLL